MPNSTARLGLQEPITSDGPSELRVAVTTNATGLDGSVLVTEGILAAIPSPPSPNVVGQTYYATDTGLWYFYTGSGWKALAFEVGSVLISSGTLASRPGSPSPNIVGQTYYATDTGQWFFYTGSAWVAVSHGPWQNITLGPSITDMTSGARPPAVRLFHDCLQLRGFVEATASVSEIGTLPAGLIPGANPYTVTMLVDSGGSVVTNYLSIGNTGVIFMEASLTSGQQVVLDQLPLIPPYS